MTTCVDKTGLALGPSCNGVDGNYTAMPTIQDWPGFHYFFCDGRFMLPKQWKGSLGTAALIMGLEGLFIGFVALKLDAPVSYIATLSGYVLTDQRLSCALICSCATACPRSRSAATTH